MTMLEIINIFTPLSDGIRVVMLVHRSKEGGHNNTHRRHLRKVITTNNAEFFTTISELKQIKDKDERALRIYATVNSCNIDKSIRLYKQRQLDRDYETLELRNKFYLDTKNQFISCLMDNSCRETKNFLFDLDDLSEYEYNNVCETLKKQTEIIISYPTKNGYHVVTKPFYYAKIDKELIKSTLGNSLMLIDY